MKKLIYLILLCPLISFAQHTTTEVEYNYLTKGYKQDMVDGRDIKSGYKIDPMGEAIAIGTYSFQFNAFIKVDEKEVAAILVIAKSSVSGNTYFLCIPLNNPQLYQHYWQELEKWDGPISRAYSYYSSTWLANLAARDMNQGMK